MAQSPIEKRNERAAQRVIKGLASRNMEGYYAATAQEALEVALSLIPEGSSVGWGGSATANEIGLINALREGNYQALDREACTTPEQREALQRAVFSADAFVMGANAITEDGQLVNLDGYANRVAALCYGPKSVVVVAGMNKVVHTLEEAVGRTRGVAAPINAQRFPGETPCRTIGVCGDCNRDDCICCQLVITRHCLPAGRIKVVLVGENLGF